MATDSLTVSQKNAIEILYSGHNTFLTGGGGVGKSFIIKNFYEYACKKFGQSSVALTSTTGISAKNIDGFTVHSYLGLGIGEESIEKIIENMSFNAKKRWTFCKVLIIDEISMLTFDLFDKINKIAKIKKSNEKPFGGIQIVVVGDFLQLPAIKSDFCFETLSWTECEFIVCNLKEIVRQSDPVFQQLLSEIRFGKCSELSEQILQSRVNVELKNDFNIIPSRIFPTNEKADALNLSELRLLIAKCPIKDIHTYSSKYKIIYNKSKLSSDDVIKRTQEHFRQDKNIPDNLTLVVGCQIIFKKNIKNPDGVDKIVNGSRGIVTSFIYDNDEKMTLPVVKFLDGTDYIVKYETFKYENPSYFEVHRSVLPIKLAWGLTIHSIQGSTVDYIKIDIGSDIFEFGQSYVALSRVKTLDGLSLLSFSKDKIFANPKVVKFYENIN